jgi:hypothetical protein
VIVRDGLLEQSVHSGMDDETVRPDRRAASGRGILGLLISDPVPIRLPDLAERTQGGEFTAEDEELLANMSRSAGRHGGTLQFANPARRRHPADPDSPSADVKRL